MPQIKSTRCTETQRCNCRFLAVNRFIVRMPTHTVLSVSIQVDENRVELRAYMRGAHGPDLREQWRHRVCFAHDPRILIRNSAICKPRREPGLRMLLAEHDHLWLLPRRRSFQFFECTMSKVDIKESWIQHSTAIKRKQLLCIRKQTWGTHSCLQFLHD